MLIGFVGLDSIHALYLAAILNGLAAPPLIALMLVLGRRERSLGRFRSGGWSLALVGTTLAVSPAHPGAYLVAR